MRRPIAWLAARIRLRGAMYLSMGDAIVPANLPPWLDAYAGYLNGSWDDFVTIASQHRGALLASISVYLADTADFLDIERGDATPDQAPQFIRERIAAGVWRPGIYCAKSDLDAVVGALNAAGIPRSAYRLWSAHWNGKHVCGPGTCGGIQVDGTQWIDHGPWDESIVIADQFFPPPPAPPTPPAPPPAPETIILPGLNLEVSMALFANDIDAEDTTVWSLYLALLGREPESADAVNYWAGVIKTQGVAACIAQVAATPEAVARRTALAQATAWCVAQAAKAAPPTPAAA